MSDEEIRQIIEAATKESLRDSFTEAGKKYLRAAEVAERKGNLQESEQLYEKAADAFNIAADKFRASKSYKNAALNMCAAGDVYSDMGKAPKAIDAYTLAAEDLFKSSGEYLMWGEDSEVRKGTAIAMAACMMFIMVGREADGFYKARTYSAENASKLKFPAVVRLSQIPQMLESAIQSVDISAFAEAENATVTELKAALASSGANEFIPYVDKGLNRVREILRGRLKSPKISAQLDIPIDMTFSEQIPMIVTIHNTGEGDALDLKAEWFLDGDLTIVAGEKSKRFPTIPPGKSVNMDITAKSTRTGEIPKIMELSIMVRGSYTDKLKTEYSLQAGPGTLVLRDTKESSKILQAIDVTQGRVGILTASILDSKLESEPLEKVASVLSKALDSVRNEVENSEIELAKARINTVNDIIDEIDAMLGDDSLIESISNKREEDKKRAVESALVQIRDRIRKTIHSEEEQIKTEAPQFWQEWDIKKRRVDDFSEKLNEITSRMSDLTTTLTSIQSQIPSAASTDDPDLAATRTRIRTSLNGVLDSIKRVHQDIRALSENAILKMGDKPDTPDEVYRAMQALKKIIQSLDE